MRPNSFTFVMFTMGPAPLPVPLTAQFRRDADMVFNLPTNPSARSLRVAWMRRMGMDEDEILESIQSDPPRSMDQELKQLRALDKLDWITPTNEAWEKVAVKY